MKRGFAESRSASKPDRRTWFHYKRGTSDSLWLTHMNRAQPGSSSNVPDVRHPHRVLQPRHERMSSDTILPPFRTKVNLTSMGLPGKFPVRRIVTTPPVGFGVYASGSTVC